MTDYWVKITEKEDEEIRRHHYLVTANDIKEARRMAHEFISHFCDEDDDPETVGEGFAFCNRAIIVNIADIKETTKEEFMNFLLKVHTIQWQ
jgi:hypothetical protein